MSAFIDDDQNGDWTKQSWDIVAHDPSTPGDELGFMSKADQLFAMLGFAHADDATRRERLAKFMALPVAQAMPAAMRQELAAKGWLSPPSD